MTTINTVTCKQPNPFDAASAHLTVDARRLRQVSNQALLRASDELDSAEARSKAAAANLLGAVVNVGWANGHALKGSLQAVGLGGGHAVAAAGVGTAAVAVHVGETSLSLGAKALNAAAKGFVSLGNALTELLGDGKTATVKEIEGHGGKRLSTRLYQTAGRELHKSGQGFVAAWASYEQAMGHALGAQVNLVHAAGYGGLAMADLAQGLGALNVAYAARAAAVAHVFGALGVQAAEAGVAGTRDLLLLGAKAAASLGRAAAHPGNAASVNVTLERESRSQETALCELLRREPELARLPAAQQFLRACTAAA